MVRMFSLQRLYRFSEARESLFTQMQHEGRHAACMHAFDMYLSRLVAQADFTGHSPACWNSRSTGGIDS